MALRLFGWFWPFRESGSALLVASNSRPALRLRARRRVSRRQRRVCSLFVRRWLYYDRCRLRRVDTSLFVNTLNELACFFDRQRTLAFVLPVFSNCITRSTGEQTAQEKYPDQIRGHREHWKGHGTVSERSIIAPRKHAHDDTCYRREEEHRHPSSACIKIGVDTEAEGSEEEEFLSHFV